MRPTYTDNRPLAIDLFCGLFGWADGLVAEGFEVVGFDLEDMCAQFNVVRPAHVHLVIQDVLTLHGSQFRTADLIVASPPCQEYSYMAMPWMKAKAKAAAIRADETGTELERLNRLFDACFRIQREACDAAGRHVPLVVENVRGAIPWVGRSRWNFGSFHLWGDVPALMPLARASKVTTMGAGWYPPGHPKHVPGQNPDGRNADAIKLGGTWFHGYRKGQGPRNHGSKSTARKMASAMIAKIPLPLSRHIARSFHPGRIAARGGHD